MVSPDGVAPIRMVSVSASVNLPLHHKVQKFSSGTGSPGWSRKKGRKTVVVAVACSPEKMCGYLSLGPVDKHAVSVQERLVKCLFRLLILKSAAENRVQLDGCILSCVDTAMPIKHGIVRQSTLIT